MQSKRVQKYVPSKDINIRNFILSLYCIHFGGHGKIFGYNRKTLYKPLKPKPIRMFFYRIQVHLCSIELGSIQCTPLKSDISFRSFSETPDVEPNSIISACKTWCNSVNDSGRKRSTMDIIDIKMEFAAL